MSQISHIKYKDIIEAGRFDPEFFKPEFLNAENLITSKSFSFLGDFFITDGEHGSPERDSTTNIKYVTAEKIKEGYIDDGEFETISLQQYNRNLRASLKPNDLLIYSVGVNCGLSAVFEEHLSPASIPRSVAIVRTDNAELSKFLCVFLISKYGKAQTKKLRAGNAQPMLALEQIKKIKYPLLNDEFYDKIAKIYNLAYSKRQKSKQLYQEAEDLLLTELGLKNHTISHTLTFHTTKKAVDEAGRYDADYFQPKYDELIEKIENYKGGWEQLINLTTYINNGNQPPYSENGNIKFFSQKWIKDKGIDYSFLESTEEPMVESSFFDEEKNKPSLVFKGDILYYSVGANLGYCHTYLADEKIAVGSFINIIRTDTSKFDSVAMGVILNSMIGRIQADRDKSGVAQPYIYAKNLRKFKIPLINSQLQKEISDKIKESFKLRNESKELLEQAKKMVEDEIEKE